jgi:16S rRNA (cytidine1402-2'-O)-methyltransferase
MSLGKLYVIATPIGNLKDITFRAQEKLKEVEVILCEDTRQTRKLCQAWQINSPLISYHQHSKIKKLKEISHLISQGKNLALVSDAGTPGISDPGHKLINYLLKEYNSLEIIPLPGPSALSAILSISDFPVDRFVFLGFLPLKKKRKKFLKQISESEYPVVFFESPHRILKTLTELNNFFKLKNPRILVGRELTKKFETIYRGTIKEVQDMIQQHSLKGEFVIVVNSTKKYLI